MTDEEGYETDEYDRRGRPPPLTIYFTSSLNHRNIQMLKLEGHLSLSPGSSGTRRNWDATETEEVLRLRFEMSGLASDRFKVTVEKGVLVIRGEGAHVEESDRLGRYYAGISLLERVYKTEGIKAEMRNGVLKVVVPKFKEERRNLINVRVD